MCVKRVFTTIITLVAIGVVSNVAAEGMIVASESDADTILLSKQVDGDYVVNRMLVKGNAVQSAIYDVRYPISKSVFSTTTSGNAAQIDQMSDFVTDLPQDTLFRVESAVVKGYASPDGNRTFNKSLATARAERFARYISSHSPLPKGITIRQESQALTWSESREAIVNSNVPERDKVLQIIDSDATEHQKEMRLKQLPAVWNYLKANVLPALRRADLKLDYCRDEIVTMRRLVPQQRQPAQTTVASNRDEDICNMCPCGMRCCCDEIIVEEHITGIMVEMAGNPE